MFLIFLVGVWTQGENTLRPQVFFCKVSPAHLSCSPCFWAPVVRAVGLDLGLALWVATLFRSSFDRFKQFSSKHSICKIRAAMRMSTKSRPKAGDGGASSRTSNTSKQKLAKVRKTTIKLKRVPKPKTKTPKPKQAAKAGKASAKTRAQIQPQFARPTKWSSYFEWPVLLLRKLFKCFPAAKPEKQIHLKLHTEFSGAATSEFAAAALAAASDGKLSFDVVSQSDIALSCQRVLIANSEPSTHIFGDIMELCGDEMKKAIENPVAVKVGLNDPFVCSTTLNLLGFKTIIQTRYNISFTVHIASSVVRCDFAEMICPELLVTMISWDMHLELLRKRKRMPLLVIQTKICLKPFSHCSKGHDTQSCFRWFGATGLPVETGSQQGFSGRST